MTLDPIEASGSVRQRPPSGEFRASGLRDIFLKLHPYPLELQNASGVLAKELRPDFVLEGHRWRHCRRRSPYVVPLSPMSDRDASRQRTTVVPHDPLTLGGGEVGIAQVFYVCSWLGEPFGVREI